mgnify:CR=1 FL=1
MNKTGGVSIPILHCVFNNGSITHYNRDYDTALYESLPNLYAVCVATRPHGGHRKVLGGFFIKTSYDHSNTEFHEACKAALQTMNEIKELIGDEFSLLPARINISADKTLSEDELVSLLFQQYFKHDEGNRA